MGYPAIDFTLVFTFLVLAHPGSPGQSPEGHKMVVVVVVLLHYMHLTASFPA